MPDDHIVDDMLRRSSDVEVPADVEARMRQQFSGFRNRLGQPRQTLRETAAALVRQRPLRWAAACAAVATVVAIVFWAGGPDGGRVYAAAVSRLATARSVRYAIEIAPFVSVEFSHLAPARERIETSWGIEIRSDGSGTQLVLLHASKRYVREQKGPGSLAHSADLVEQLTSLPKTADSMLGERTVAGKRFVGYRVMGARMAGGHGLEWLDLWLDAESGAVDHVDLTPSGAGASGYQMHIRNIRVDSDVDPVSFDMTPPAGYVEVESASAAGPPNPEPPTELTSLQPKIAQAEQQPAIVVPMSGSFLQAGAAADRVAQYLRQRGVLPAGAAFGRFESESHWEVGYPVQPGTSTEPPFEAITVPGGPVASVVVTGPWGRNSAARWSRLFAWLGEQGLVVVGPPTEIWSGDETHPDAQSTEMRIAVAPARR
jgi:effector-binding domain-containing protein/outer membrane lipoprotein-sorting protein